MKCKNFEYRALEKQAKGHPMTTPTTPASPDSVERAELMRQWDFWRKAIANGDKTSAPRDWFESIVDALLAATPAAGGGEAVAYRYGTALLWPDDAPIGEPDCEPLYTHPQPSALPDEVVKDAERMSEALDQIKQWAEAYPLSVFPEPDFAKAHEVLAANGMTLDAISASNMRYVITRVQAIVDAAMLKEGK